MRPFKRCAWNLAPLLVLAGSADAVMSGSIEARLVIMASCEVSSGGTPTVGDIGQLNFGSQGPIWTRPLNANVEGSGGSLQVACNTPTSGFSVSIDGGVNGDGTTRRLSNGHQTIAYHLSTDAAGTDTYSIGQQRNFAVDNARHRSIPVYGVVLANRHALPAGIYRDTLTITLDW